MNAIPSQITNLTIVYSTVYSGADQRRSLAFVRGILRWPVNCPGKGPVMRKRSPKQMSPKNYNGEILTNSDI